MGRACPGHPRLCSCCGLGRWMPATSAGMTECVVRLDRNTLQNGRATSAERSSVPKVEMIKSLERGLQGLQALRASPMASLHDLFLATRISKPSLLRILNTLEHAGVVSRRLADGQYRISAFARMGRKRDPHDSVAEAGAPVLHPLRP